MTNYYLQGIRYNTDQMILRVFDDRRWVYLRGVTGNDRVIYRIY